MANIADLSLEELGNIEITSVSGYAERLVDAAASIFVITSDDIRRSGYRTLPDVLRLAPNLQVARSGANGYAISARGFNNDNGLANKLLVLIDGRTVYSLSLSGVFWDMQDVMLEDVERIEVISGPGATLWGANAVNGVINIISRSTRNTQGVLVTLGGGNQEKGAAVRYGGRFGSNGHFRVYGKTDDFQNTKSANGNSLPDGWERGQVGFRADWVDVGRSFTIQGDAYKGRSEDRPVFNAVEVSGANLLARWNQRLNNGSDIRLQAYYDHTDREDQLLFRDDIKVFDIEFQQGITLGAHKVLWGTGYRQARNDMRNSLFFGFVPSFRKLNWKNLFAQDEIKLTQSVDLTVGLKLESNDYTGWEYLPSARLAWKPSGNQLVWGSVSRAVRAPARLDRELRFPPNGLFINGGPNFVSEVANVIELGYRAQPTSTFTYSVTAFHHIYDKLRSGQPAPFANVENKMEGTANGIEAWATFQAARAWRLSGGFTTLHKHLRLKPGSTDPVGPSALGNDPDQQWMLRSAFNFTDRHEFDVMVRHVSSLPQPAVPAYTAADARFGWRASRDVEVSLTLQNLFDREHAEFGVAPGRSEYQRGVFLKLLWRM
ncbi:MAG TPA: TonB-dependent receptor [Burkholderiales bacterium]|nr:TonB-dependent receptor [Burkholderiales bacterium]